MTTRSCRDNRYARRWAYRREKAYVMRMRDELHSANAAAYAYGRTCEDVLAPALKAKEQEVKELNGRIRIAAAGLSAALLHMGGERVSVDKRTIAEMGPIIPRVAESLDGVMTYWVEVPRWIK